MGTSDEQGVNEPFVLDPDNPVEAAVIDLLRMQRAKNRDYAEDGSVFSNFEMTADLTNQAPEESALFNVAQKLVRLRSLKANGRTADPTNESVQDTYLDLAVYAIIAYAIVRQAAQEVAAEERRELFKGLTDEINDAVRTSGGSVQRMTDPYAQTVHIDTTGLTGEQLAMEARRRLDGVDWSRSLRG